MNVIKGQMNRINKTTTCSQIVLLMSTKLKKVKRHNYWFCYMDFQTFKKTLSSVAWDINLHNFCQTRNQNAHLHHTGYFGGGKNQYVTFFRSLYLFLLPSLKISPGSHEWPSLAAVILILPFSNGYLKITANPVGLCNYNFQEYRKKRWKLNIFFF